MPLPTVNPMISRSPFPATSSTMSRLHHPTMDALEFHRSAFSTNPIFPGSSTGTTGGGGTPGGDATSFAFAAFSWYSSMERLMSSTMPALGERRAERARRAEARAGAATRRDEPASLARGWGGGGGRMERGEGARQSSRGGAFGGAFGGAASDFARRGCRADPRARASARGRGDGRAARALAPRPSIHFFRRRRGGAAGGEARRARGRRGGGAGNGGETHPRRAESAVGRTEAAEAEMQAIVVDARRGAVCAMARAGTRGVAPRGADVDVARRGSRFGKYSRDWIATQTHFLISEKGDY